MSTIGRPEQLNRLMESIATSDGPAVEVIVVDQDPAKSCQRVATQAWPFPVVYAGSQRGLSLGRNVGLSLASGDICAFPDDEAWYPPNTLDRAWSFLVEHPEVQILCGQQVDEAGAPSLLRFAQAPRSVSRFNLTRTVVSSPLFVRREVFASIGNFDTGLGAGSSGWHLAGEETDLVLRAIRSGHRVVYRPEVQVGHPAFPPDRSEQARLKQLSYACSAGEIYRRHGFPRWYLGWLLLRRSVKVAGLVARGNRVDARFNTARLTGLVAGWRRSCPKDLEPLRVAALSKDCE